MKIVLATFGSRGDVHPMLVLSSALKAAGHEVLLAAPPENAGLIKQSGCPFYPLGGDITAFIEEMENAYSLHSSIRFIHYIHNEMISQFEILKKIIAGADLVIGASLVFALSTVAELMEIEYRYIAFTPQLLPSGRHPPIVFKHHGLPEWYNRMAWKIIRVFDKLNLTRLINKKRKELGLKPVQDVWVNVLGKKVIVASDRVIAPVPQDVDIAFTQTGYLHLEQPDQHLPELEQFLSNGRAPVFAGFGSMPAKDQAEIVPEIVQAARAAGRRVIIGKFWDGPSEFSNSNDLLFIGRYPHLKLFPNMAAVIHHGGAGTVATGAISGVPQIIVPHVLDQYYWGHQLYQSGLGPKPIWRSKLTPKKLSAAIQECLSNDLIIEKAKATSEMINPKDSLEMAVREVLKGDKRTF